MFKHLTVLLTRLIAGGSTLLSALVLAQGADGAVKKAEAAVSKAGDGLREYLPDSALTPSLFGLQRWQWAAIPLLGLLIALLTILLVRLSAMLLRRVSKGSTSVGRMLERLDRPFKLGWAALLSHLVLPVLALSDGADAFWHRCFRVALGGAFFWGSLRAVTTWSDSVISSSYVQTRPGSRALINLFSRVGRFALIGFAALAMLSELGYSVGSVLAGLGIGGIALALGAQKTLENLFGAFALAVDQPIREGDLVRVDDVVGTVESIGLRSTRIRTIDRTLVSIPNGKLADMRLETLAVKDRLRLHTTIGLRPTTTAAQLGQIIEGFSLALEAQPLLCPQTAAVHLVKLGDASQDLEISAWFATTQDDVFRRIRQELLLQFMATVQSCGSALASPTQTVHLIQESTQ